jgi:pyruvate dehydrogenase E1 component
MWTDGSARAARTSSTTSPSTTSRVPSRHARPRRPRRVIRGIYRYRAGSSGSHEAHILSSGTIVYEALRAQELLAGDWDVKADVWSAPGWNRLLRDGTECESWNRMHPETEDPRVPLITQALEGTNGPYVAVSDWLKATPVQIADWVPGRFAVLGTDGFGRSDTREALRRLHKIDAESIAVTVLAELAAMGEVDRAVVAKAIDRYEIDTERWPFMGNRDTGDVTF